ncbi:37S ribosomal protein S24, mitochondrial [Candida viswanathii]|uniref:37S ribosomal protein S24, mitochondrial n=1 Tax=Candida viswanathii TaxID=5486 RepID=A0A367XR11_9ASCO|nr:37S ribosomal protein S24, mitochondrial [Candida viswanathii]
MRSNWSKVVTVVRRYSKEPAAGRTPSVAGGEQDPARLFLNPHAWKGLPADQVFELHLLRVKSMKDAYNPTNDERTAILSTIKSLSGKKAALDYAFEIENFKEKLMNNTPMKERGTPQKLSNQFVINDGSVPHHKRRIENLTRVAAYEIPLLAKYRQPYNPRPSQETPLQLTYNSDFSEETSNSHNRKIKLSVRLSDLNLNPQQEHKFKILAGNKFNHVTGTFNLKCERYPEAAQNVNWAVTTFHKLLEESRDLKETFADIPLRKPIKKKNKVPVNFPRDWKRPAPLRPNNIVERLVADAEAVKDEAYLQSISP